MTERHDARGGDGKFTRTPDTAERDAEAARLRARGLSYRAVAAEMGYASGSSAYDAVQRCLASIVEEPARAVQKLELERLDTMFAKTMEIAEREHLVVSAGKVAVDIVEYATDAAGNILLDDDGRPMAKRVAKIRDDGPALQATKTLLLIMERRARLLGLDSPIKADVGGTLRYEILGVDLGALK